MDKLPFRRSLIPAYILSLIVAVLLTITALASISYRYTIYPTAELRHGFVATDVGNLVIALPLLMACLWLTRRGKTSALLLWPGALFYVLYGYLPYLIVIPFGLLFPAYSLLITFSLYTIIYLIANLDAAAIRQRFAAAPAKIGGGALVVLAGFNILRQAVLMVTAAANQAPVALLDQAMWIADFTFFVPALLVGGILLWRGRPLGYATGPALLLAYSALVFGLIPVVMVQARAGGLPFPIVDIVVLLIMAAICLVPLLLFFQAGNK
ncbi:MAG: hypothetical protein ABIA75_14960 [Candidatus Neomarinimicrobiota bacterium]